MTALRDRVRSLRNARGLSLRQLGEAVGVSAQSVWQWEHGKSQLPSEELPRIATALGLLGVGELYGEVPYDTTREARLNEVLDKLKAALELGPERIEIHIHTRGQQQQPEPSAVPAGEFEPTRADRDTRDVLRAWPSLTEEQRQGWLAFAEAIRAQEGGEP